MADASDKYERERRNEEATPSSPLTRLWSHFKNAFSRNDDERRREGRTEGGEPLSMAWVWSQFKAELPQSDEERRALDEQPAPMAWVWSQFKAVLPQHDEERRALNEAPTPMAWVWSQFRARFPQSDEERRALDGAPSPMAWLWSQFRAELPQTEGERRALRETPAPMAWLWSKFKAQFPQSDEEQRALDGAPTPMAWLWSQFRAEFPQSDEERHTLDEAPAPMAWLWSQFRAEFPQSDEERRALDEAPAPMAWLWSQFKAEVPQSAEERRALDETPTPMAWVWSQFKAELPQSDEERHARDELRHAIPGYTPPKSRRHDEASRSSLRLPPAKEPPKAERETIAVSPKLATAGRSRSLWLLAVAAVLTIAGVTWRLVVVPRLSDKVSLATKEEVRPSGNGDTNIPTSQEIAPAQAQKTSPAAQTETARTGANETSTEPPEDAHGAPKQEMSSTRSAAEPAPQEHEEGGGVATPAQPVVSVNNDSTQIKLPNGIELSVPNSGLETKLLEFLKHASNKPGEFDFDRISFGATNAILSPSSSEHLQNVAKILRAYPTARIAINALAANATNGASGLGLSRARASSVLGELARRGVDKSRMVVRVYADNRATRSSGLEEGQGKDQRISLTVTRR
jgi:outer membrane protein OmpA-like peptidoglycan-associated protein